MGSLNTSIITPMYSIGTLEVTYEAMVAKYVAIGALAVLIWDILDNILEDYQLLFGKQRTERRMSFAMLAYVSSRVSTVGYHLTSVMFSTAPIGHCSLLDKFANAWCPLSVAGSGFLFFIRLKAIYNRNPAVIAVFSVLWIGLVVGGIFFAVGVQGGAAGTTQYCKYVSVARYVLYGQTMPLFFDTLVFLAISWRLSRIASIDNKGNIGSMLFGTHLPAFSRSLLQDGQIYYGVTIVVGIASMVLIFRGIEHPSPLSDMMENVYLVLLNIMSCRVFRRTRAGKIRETEISTSVINQESIKFTFGNHANSVNLKDAEWEHKSIL